jgi:primosomal protein N' (replication factor Y)
LVDEEVLLDGPLLELLEWTSSYYAASLGETMRIALAADMPVAGHSSGRWALAGGGKQRKRREPPAAVAGVGRLPEGQSMSFSPAAEGPSLNSSVRSEPVPSLAVARVGAMEGLEPCRLTAAQSDAVAEVTSALLRSEFTPFVVHGVTGSGKTEVYLRAIAAALSHGRGAMVLAPEIALTPQLAACFRARFGDQVAVLHSGLGRTARYEQWARLRERRARIVLGARSAVFAPVADLGVVVVDEEHDPSFKQQDGVRYNGRDVALVRAQRSGAVAILGSATPSLESFRAAQAGRYRWLVMSERVAHRPLPTVELVDLRTYSPGKNDLLTAPLSKALRETIAAGDQAILFLNRRGYAPAVVCSSCGDAIGCRDCSVALTFHGGASGGGGGRRGGRLSCHYCGRSSAPPAHCPKCLGTTLDLIGTGTERVEEALRATLAAELPTARVARLDRDSVTTHRQLERTLDAFRGREIDVLVGTQMVTKGHDFPGVTLVGVLLADIGLTLPDFRAGERTFQLLTQVAGRAGRGERPGRVIIQTYCPDHPALRSVKLHDGASFYEQELAARDELGYPPTGRLVLLRVDGVDPATVATTAEALATLARRAATHGVAVVGPAEAPLSKLRGRLRWHLLLRGGDRRSVREVLDVIRTELGRSIKVSARCRVTVDVDPVSTL